MVLDDARYGEGGEIPDNWVPVGNPDRFSKEMRDAGFDVQLSTPPRWMELAMKFHDREVRHGETRSARTMMELLKLASEESTTLQEILQDYLNGIEGASEPEEPPQPCEGRFEEKVG